MVFYNEMIETVISEEMKTKGFDLLSSIGGTLSLFSGFTLLSLVDLVEIFAKIVIVLVENRSKLRRRHRN